MNVFMSALIKMSLRGIVIILIVMLVRLLLKKLRISHKYIVGLWAMAFLFLTFPWKISLSVGFWDNSLVPETVRVITEIRSGAEDIDADANTVNIVNTPIETDNIMVGTSSPSLKIRSGVALAGDVMGTVTSMPVEPANPNMEGIKEEKKDSTEKPEVGRILSLLWLVGLMGLSGHMLYSYFAIKKKLLLRVLYQDNIWWVEDIDIPMVFGLIRPQIYLPVSMEAEDLSYVIAHEKTHVRRKDVLFKMFAYVVCLFHWINPFVWIAYILLGNDMEKACDEEVIRSLDKEKRKEYAYALLHIAAENGTRKKRVFVAPICFDEGNVKSRIKNIMKFKYTLPGLGTMVVVVIAALSVLFLTEAKGAEQEGPEQETVETQEAGGAEEGAEKEGIDPGNAEADVFSGEETEALPAFYMADLDVLQIEENFSLEDYYISSRYTASNYYYIDEDGVLWGTGQNEFGQLGTGTYGYEEYHEEPVRIAEHVVSVDASWNDYFCIYLTEGGGLYGIGLNYAGLLLGKGSETQVYSQYDFQKVTEPVLLMTDVAYARAGRECIVALKTDRTAYWWGQYAPLTHTHAYGGFNNYWKVEEDATNPEKMLAVEPMKIMDHCKYITTGTFTGAAISESGELYTWGLNVFGQCGTPVTEDDFVRTPVKVMDDVKMVWSDRVAFSDSTSRSPEYGIWETDYKYNTFVLKEDNTLLAVGLDLGDKEKITEVNGDLVETQTHMYGDRFVPIRAVEYSIDNMLKALSELEFGMSVEEAEEILSRANLRTFRVDESVYGEGYHTGVSALYNQYHCYFDSQNRLVLISVQEGGSRDGRFTLGMSFTDLEDAVRESGGSLTKGESNTWWETWLYQDQEQQIQYEFFVYEGYLTLVDETGMIGNDGQ